VSGSTTTSIDAFVLLAGGLRPSPLVRACGLSVLDLPIRSDFTVLGWWLDRIGRATRGHLCDLTLGAIAYTANSPAPTPTAAIARNPGIRLVCDQSGLRGPAGTARDLCRGMDANEVVLLGEAARFIDYDLTALIDEFAASDADASVAQNPDGSPAGVYLTRMEVLDLVPSEGFMDLKEQWLTRALNSGFRVMVHALPPHVSYPLRTWEQFLTAARHASGMSDHESDKRFVPDFGDTRSSVSIVLPGAQVAESAVIVDSILMPGCIVHEHAVVVRSLIGSGVRVRPGAQVIDSIQCQLDPAPSDRNSSGIHKSGNGHAT